MTLTKKHWTIIGVVAALVIIYFAFIRKKKYTESSFDAALPLIGENGYEGDQINGPVGESGYVTLASEKKKIKQNQDYRKWKTNH